MRYFYDLEFLEGGRTIDLISIGIVSEVGAEYYAVNAAVDDSRNDADLGERIARQGWLMENVVPHLPLHRKVTKYTSSSWRYMPPNLDMGSTLVRPLWLIANEVREFLRPVDGDPVELWAWYGAYDHVALMQLWGRMVDKPEQLPMWTRDVRQFAEHLGVDKSALPARPDDAHHALADARWCRDAWRYLNAISNGCGCPDLAVGGVVSGPGPMVGEGYV